MRESRHEVRQPQDRGTGPVDYDCPAFSYLSLSTVTSRSRSGAPVVFFFTVSHGMRGYICIKRQKIQQ